MGLGVGWDRVLENKQTSFMDSILHTPHNSPI